MTTQRHTRHLERRRQRSGRSCRWPFAAAAAAAATATTVCEATKNVTPPHVHRRVPSLVVRYSVLDPDVSRGYLMREGLPMLRSTLCLVERYLTPVLAMSPTLATSGPPSYLIYTDSGTDQAVAALIARSFETDVQQRIRLINLDEDPTDAKRLDAAANLPLDARNAASVRRTLADVTHLPPGRRRLLLGVDVSFLSPAHNLVAEIERLGAGQALYMQDLFLDTNPLREPRDLYLPYWIRDYDGPQCPGLLGDFVYLGPDVRVSMESLLATLQWYARRPRVPWRTTPVALHLSGFHGIDQFALSMALGQAVEPAGPKGCLPLQHAQYRHQGAVGRPPRDGIEAIHDKVISSCGSRSFDMCDSAEDVVISARDREDRQGVADNIGNGNAAFCRCGGDTCNGLACGMTPRCVSVDTVTAGFDRDTVFGLVPEHSFRYSPDPEILLLMSTLCQLEAFFAESTREMRTLPSYVVYSNDRTCGTASALLLHEFPDMVGRLKLINMDTDPSVETWSRVFAAISSCTDARKMGEIVLVLEVLSIGSEWDSIQMVGGLLPHINNSHAGGHSFKMINTAHVQRWEQDRFKVVIYLCHCSKALGLPCPAALEEEFMFYQVAALN
eukprot:TRINITY_DN49982_c0_g1_i1.p1 TRINITY_DN49982_c0_g1~~TRINITY_DN49982_c0_g1_i1.p1  ORF type:complete len:614 (-),score=90.00 TRINITY_DN49982_c0_g1_i1:183-2024(-)